MHACPHVALHSPGIVQLQGTDAPTHTHTLRHARSRVFGFGPGRVPVSANFYQFHFQLTGDQNTQTGSANHQQLPPERSWALTKSFCEPGHQNPELTHTHIHTDTRQRHAQRDISRDTSFFFLFASLCVCVCVAQESFSFLSFQFRCQQSCFLYYTTYFISSGRNVCALCKPSPQSQSHPLSLRKPYPLESFLRNCATHNSFANRNSLICCLCVCVSRMTRISLTGLQSF